MELVEAQQIIARVSGAYGRSFRPESVTEWTRHLEQQPAELANEALDRIIRNGEPGPSIARLLAEISALRPRRLQSNAGKDGCPRCNGLGWIRCRPDSHEPGIVRYEPCMCHPKAAL